MPLAVQCGDMTMLQRGLQYPALQAVAGRDAVDTVDAVPRLCRHYFWTGRAGFIEETISVNRVEQ